MKKKVRFGKKSFGSDTDTDTDTFGRYRNRYRISVSHYSDCFLKNYACRKLGQCSELFMLRFQLHYMSLFWGWHSWKFTYGSSTNSNPFNFHWLYWLIIFDYWFLGLIIIDYGFWELIIIDYWFCHQSGRVFTGTFTVNATVISEVVSTGGWACPEN